MEAQIEADSKYNDFEGEFQPLSYWANLGYDPELIKANTPPDMQEFHPQLGQVYKVKVHKQGERHSRGTENRETLDGIFRRQRAAAGSSSWQDVPLAETRAPATNSERLPVPLAAKPRKAGSSSDSESESSSAPSDPRAAAKKLAARAKQKANKLLAKAKRSAKKESDKKRKRANKDKQKAEKAAKKKKHEEDKADKEVEKQRKAEEAQAEREKKIAEQQKQRELDAKVQFASQAHIKLVASLTEFRKCEDEPRFADLGDAVTAKLNQAKFRLEGLKQIYGQVVVDKTVDLPDDCTNMKELNEICVAAKKELTIANSMLKSIGRMNA